MTITLFQCCTPALGLKYLCVSWRCYVTALLTVLETGLPLARRYPDLHDKFWHTLHHALDAFLFSSRLVQDAIAGWLGYHPQVQVPEL